MVSPLMHYSTEDFSQTLEEFCTVNKLWTTARYTLDTGPSEPICNSCNTILTDDIFDPAHHKLFDGQWFCRGRNVSFPEVPNLCPNCGESILADADTIHGRSEQQNTAVLSEDPDTLPDGGGTAIDPATEPPPYEEP